MTFKWILNTITADTTIKDNGDFSKIVRSFKESSNDIIQGSYKYESMAPVGPIDKHRQYCYDRGDADAMVNSILDDCSYDEFKKSLSKIKSTYHPDNFRTLVKFDYKL